MSKKVIKNKALTEEQLRDFTLNFYFETKRRYNGNTRIMIEFLRRLREDGLLHHLKGNSGLTFIEQKLIEQISDGML